METNPKIAQLESEISQLRNQRALAVAPAIKTLDEIKAQIAFIVKPFDTLIESLEAAITAVNVAEFKAKIDAIKQSVKTYPTPEQFLKAAERCEQVFGIGGYLHGTIEAIRPPKVAGYKLHAARCRNEKVYAAWSETDSKLVGYMFVEGARHVADDTQAKALVNGVEVVFPEKGYGIGAPVETFVKALAAAGKN